MTDDTELTPIQKAWVDFIASLRQLLITKLDDRALDQYLEFRDEVLKLALKKELLDELEKAWSISLDFTEVELFGVYVSL